MNSHIALLRAVNVGGKNLVRMEDLRQLLAGLGFTHVRTLLQSGNVVFQSDHSPNSDLEDLLEAAFAERFKLGAKWMVRSAEEWSRIIEHNPFPSQAVSDPTHLVLVALKAHATPTSLERLQEFHKGPETIQGINRELYIVYPDGMGHSKLTGAVLDRHLGVQGTARNWNTVLKLRNLAAS